MEFGRGHFLWVPCCPRILTSPLTERASGSFPYLLGCGAEFGQGSAEVFGTLTQLHGRGLVLNGGHGGLGGCHHLPTWL